MTSLSGRTALVTGASRGIGREVARTFAAHGADVAIAARSVEPLEALAEEITGLGRTCVVIVADVLQDDSAQRIADQAMAGLGSSTSL
jgi:NAD(P)-dependent dehydrogenase (short-subunit alcohol dehydrogenase family)